ncbi:uncharacterized protein K452DRAFT_299494 [Aplosporella prunicola CBS 121167]|uniref:EH domain-containing protein n=1 Tax=Aplosporella prunicola CBS 121167 TaxID=1176127 RepID=A0A6A6B998_9PEZI|nr:uncharacterized protein K452DRAFT_299494 [Aplosporella prunicola CBS 121167]KAF2140789.1 hypothetical protein K452DRAFT_299494 [Aplosporella prunicola CBS 121167]
MTAVTLSPMPPPAQRPAETTVPHNTRDAALRGASAAFAKPPTKPKPALNTYSGSNGALAAAKRSTTPQQPARIQRQETGNSVRSTTAHNNSNNSNNTLSPRSAGPLGVPSSPGTRARSPSILAASLAAARHTPAPSENTDTKARSSTVASRQSSSRSTDSTPGRGAADDTKARYGMDKKALTPTRSPKGSVVAKTPETTDATSIQPTTNLVKMFEQNNDAPSKSPRPSPKPSPKPKPILGPVLTSRGPAPEIKSPKPQRNITPQFAAAPSYGALQEAPPPKAQRPVSAGEGEARRVVSDKPRPKPKPAALSGEVPTKGRVASSQSAMKPTLPPIPAKKKAPDYDASRRKSDVPPPRKADDADSDDSEAYASAPETKADETKEKPSVPPPRKKGVTKPAPADTAVITTITNAPAVPPPRRAGQKPALPERTTQQPSKPVAPPPPRRRSHSDAGHAKAPPPTLPSTSSTYKRGSLKLLQPHMTGDGLANAMVGAALASSQGTSPASTSAGPPLPPPRKGEQHHHHLLPHGHHKNPLHALPLTSRTPSPPKRTGANGTPLLRPTLRKQPSSSSEDSDSGRDTKHKRKRHLGPKAPNRHAEGARRRWRDSVTPREKKRYEGVWAANKGLCLEMVYPRCGLKAEDEGRGLEDEVVGAVVRDIWGRSRLPAGVLQEVWDLVDERGVGRLRREEFVVGMWLVDQALKGRKLPVKVQESVWRSVTGAGVKIRVRK